MTLYGSICHAIVLAQTCLMIDELYMETDNIEAFFSDCLLLTALIPSTCI